MIDRRIKNVLFIIANLKIGGAEKLLLNLVNNLDVQKFKSVIFSLGSPDDPLVPLIRPEVQKEVFPRKWRYDTSPANELIRIVEEKEIETIISFGLFPAIYCRKVLIRRPSLQLVISLHSTKPRNLKDLFQKVIIPRQLPSDTRYIAISNNQKEYYIRKFFINPNRFHTIFNGVDTTFWHPPQKEFDRKLNREKWGIPENAIVITNVSLFRPEKRHDLMLQAFSRIQIQKSPVPIYLLFVGGGNEKYESNIKKLAQNLGIAKKVIFSGMQSDVRSFYWLSDIFTLASTEIETFSLAALEAMSTGLPCVLTEIGGANEMIRPGENGFLVKPGSIDELVYGWEQCILRLTTFDPNKIREGIVNQFDLKRCVRNYEKFLLNNGLPNEKEEARKI